MTGVQVSEATGRRLTYVAGAVLVAQLAAQAPALAPPADPGPDTTQRLQVSADGAMVGLVGGAWAEVRTLVIGEVPQGEGEAANPHHATHLSYFSRLESAAEFTRSAVVETHRRGLRAAAEVAGVMDGAPWLQSFLDYHRPDAVRILDAPHALEHLHALAEALLGVGEPAKTWWQQQKALLYEQGAEAVLAEVELRAGEALNTAGYAEHRSYLVARREQMNYPVFRARGWPIGSGIVESANKLVVEKRMKGAGMRWEGAHVNPMLSLRNAECSGRWAESWASAAAGRREQVRKRREQQKARRAKQPAQRVEEELGQSAEVAAPEEAGGQMCVVDRVGELPVVVASAISRPGRPPGQPYKPSAKHPWRGVLTSKAPADLPY